MNKQFIQKLAKIQKELKSPKSQFNKFGNYAYRNAEDILESVKPFLGELSLTLNDEVVSVGDRIYIKSTATITDGESSQSTTAFAREPESAKGMSDSQLSGATSSYSSKYALGKLFLLDDTKDADSNEVATLTKEEPKGFKKKDPPKKESEATESEQVEAPANETPRRASFRRKG